MSFGREARLPVDVMFAASEIRQSWNKYMDDLRRDMEAYYGVRERTKVSGEAFKRDDQAWIHQPCTCKTISRKLHQPWSGPYKVLVVKRISDSGVTQAVVFMYFFSESRVIFFV